MAERHAPFLVVLALGAVLRIIATVAYEPALLYVDSYGYLLNSENLDPTLLWPAGYSLFLKLVLAIGPLPLVPVIQHLLGLGMAITIYVLLLRWGAPRWLAVVATVPVLLDGYQLHSESRVLTETLFQSLIVAGLAILTWRRQPGWWAVALGGLLLGLTVPVRMVGQVVLLVAFLGVSLSLVTSAWGHRRSTVNAGPPPLRWRSALGRLGVLGVAMAIPVTGYAAYYYNSTGNWNLAPDWLGDRMLYSRAARFMDCGQFELRDEYRPLCPTDEQQATVRTDDFNWGGQSPLRSFEPPQGITKAQAAGEVARAAIMAQPLDFAYWYGKDLLKSFALRRDTFEFDMPIERWRFQTEWPEYRDDWRSILSRYWDGEPEANPTLAQGLRTYQLTVGAVPPIFLGLAAFAGLAGGAVALRRGERQLAAAALTWTGVGLAVLAMPALFQFSQRYQIPSFVLLPVGGALGLRILLRSWRYGRQPFETEVVP